MILGSSSDLAGRLTRLATEGGPAVIIACLFVVLGGFLLVGQRKTEWLIAGYSICLMFSGHFVDAVDTGTTVVRWGVIGLIAIASLNGVHRSGTVCSMLAAYWAFSIFTVLWSPAKSFGLQVSVLSLAMTGPAALAMSHCYKHKISLSFVPKSLCFVSVLFVANGLVGFSALSGGRYSGATTSAPLFVITGGLLMPALIWGYFNLKGKQQTYCALACLCVFGLCLLSGQRTGFFAGVLGSVPLLARFGVKRIAQGIAVIALAIGLGFVAIAFFPEQAEFMERRYNVTNFTGREYAWTWSLRKIEENPILGYGAASHVIRGWGFHNAFLQEWHNGGILGLLLFFGAFVVAFFKSVQLSFFSAINSKDRELARLMLGWTIAMILGGFFESKLSSPSNILTFCIVQVGLILMHIEQSAGMRRTT